MRHLRSGERGQMLILMVAVMTVTFAVAAVAVDFSIYFSERRGAQKDADASTLAGAYELLQQNFVNPGSNNVPAIQSNVANAAYAWAERNGIAAADVHNLMVNNSSCLGHSAVLDSVALDAEHHSQALFSSIFGLVAPQIGAHARACLGSIVSAEGMLPVGVQIEGFQSACWQDVDGDGQEDPLFGQQCNLTFGSGNLTSGEGGRLRLFNDGSLDCSARNTGGGNNYRDEIRAGGADTTCHVLPQGETCVSDPSGCVYPQTGDASNPERAALRDWIATEGECDSLFGDGNGVDAFLEAVKAVNGDPTPSPDTLFAKRACESPRLISLIIIDHFDPTGNSSTPIRAFASFFIDGCRRGTGPVIPSCNVPGGQGQVYIVGHFVNILDVKGGVGEINKWSPKRIILKE